MVNPSHPRPLLPKPSSSHSPPASSPIPAIAQPPKKKRKETDNVQDKPKVVKRKTKYISKKTRGAQEDAEEVDRPGTQHDTEDSTPVNPGPGRWKAAWACNACRHVRRKCKHKKSVGDLFTENSALRSVLERLRNHTIPDAIEALTQIRTADNLDDALKSIRDNNGSSMAGNVIDEMTDQDAQSMLQSDADLIPQLRARIEFLQWEVERYKYDLHTAQHTAQLQLPQFLPGDEMMQ